MKHLKRAYEQMKTNKDDSLTSSSLGSHFKEKNENEWISIKRDEYETLYPYSEEHILDESAVIPTYEEWLNGEVCPPYDTTSDILLFKSTDLEYKKYYDAINTDNLNKLIVTVSTGKRFYADPSSRADLADAISILMENGLVDYNWKTVDGIVLVTLAELKEARTLGLQAKGTSVGIA